MLLKAEGLYVFGPYRLDAHERQLLRNGEPVPLPPRAFDLLLALVARAGSLATKDELLSEVWAGTFVEEVNLSYTVSLLRKALGEEGYIETVPKSGYRFAVLVSVLSVTTAETTSPTPRTGKARKYSNARWLAALVTLGLLAVGAWMAWRPGFSRSSELITTPIASLGGLAENPHLSPDGTKIVYQWDGRRNEADAANWDIYLLPVEGGEPQRLTTDPATEFAPAWSPDGERIAFLRAVAPGRAIIRAIPASGGSERTLSPDGVFANPNPLDWSPDGNSIVFQTPDASGRPGLALLSLVTGRVRPLTMPPTGRRDRFARFSPDGLSIAFSRIGILHGGYGDLYTANGDLYTVPVGGGAERPVTSGGRGIGGHDWTVDGKELVFSSDRGGYWTLWRIAADGSEREPRPVGIGTDAFLPSIARTKNRLAYREQRVDSDIWRVPVSLSENGAAPSVGTAVLVQGSTRLDTSPQVSADGRRLVFASQRSGDEGIWVSDMDGGSPLQIAAFQGYPAGSPRWSPTGTRVVFDASPFGHADIFIVGAQGIPRPVRLTEEAAENVFPSWSKDEGWIYFASNRTGRYEVWKAPVNGGGSPTQVSKGGGFAPVESPDGEFVYYLKGIQSGQIWRVPVGGGEETFVVDGPTPRFWGYWALLADGICFATWEGPHVPALVHYFDFASKLTTRVGRLDAPAIVFSPGFAMTPDGKSILYVKMKPTTSDIMLVKNFR
jgi:Tol biopolymer transport system component/DNA-binding winged helix-turn-helix (wHTH) protein